MAGQSWGKRARAGCSDGGWPAEVTHFGKAHHSGMRGLDVIGSCMDWIPWGHDRPALSHFLCFRPPPLTPPHPNK
eukprot:364948-Chlamydomonas_euryale.AAC.21